MVTAGGWMSTEGRFHSVGQSEASIPEEIRGLALQGSAQLHPSPHRWVPVAPFDADHVVPVQISELSQLLLSHPKSFPPDPYGKAKVTLILRAASSFHPTSTPEWCGLDCTL